MLLLLRGLPPDIEIAEIRNLIHHRCQVNRVLLDELEADAGGTRRVIVGVTKDSDGAMLRRVLSGQRLGVYTLVVEPHQQRQPLVNDQELSNNSGGLGGYNADTDDGLGGQTAERYSSGLGGLGENSGNREKNIGGSGLGGNSGTDGAGLGGLNQNCYVGLASNNARDGDGFGRQGLGGLRGNNERNGYNLGGLGSDSGRNTGGLGGLGGNSNLDQDIRRYSKRGSRKRSKRRKGNRGRSVSSERDVGLGGGGGLGSGGLGSGGLGSGGLGSGGLGSGGLGSGGLGSGLIRGRENPGLGGYNSPRNSQVRGGLGDHSGSYSTGGLCSDNYPHSTQKKGGLGGLNAPNQSKKDSESGDHNTATAGSREESSSSQKLPPWQLAMARNENQKPEEIYSALVTETGGLNYLASGQSYMLQAQNQAPDPGRKVDHENSGIGSGRVPPWLAKHSQQQVTDQQHPSRRQGSALARRPADRTLPDRSGGRKRLHSPSLPPPPPPPPPAYNSGQSAQPQMGMQGQYITYETTIPPTQPGMYNQSTTMFSPPWAVPQPLMGFSAAMPVPANPPEQFGLFHSFQNQPPPMYMPPQYDQSFQPFNERHQFKKRSRKKQKQRSARKNVYLVSTNESLPNQRNKLNKSKNSPSVSFTKLLQSNTQSELNKVTEASVTKQTLPNKQPQPKRAGNKQGYMAAKSERITPVQRIHKIIYREKIAQVFHTMFERTKSFDPAIPSFTAGIKNILRPRLRVLANKDPVGKDLVKLYRAAYPPSTDEIIINAVLKKLNLSCTPLPRKVEESIPQWKEKRDEKYAIYDNLDDTGDNNSTTVDHAKYINPKLKLDDAQPEQSSIDGARMKMEELKLQSSFITARILKPDCKGKNNLPPEHMCIYPYLKDLVDAEIQTFPQEVLLGARDTIDLFRIYHERTSRERNRHFVDTAIEKYNANDKKAYKGAFSNPDIVENIIAMWPDFYDGDSNAESNVQATSTKRKLGIKMWLIYAKMIIASEIFETHKAEYDKHEKELEIEYLLKSLRVKISCRMDGLSRKDTEKIVSTRTAVEAYRRKHPASTDLELLRGVIQQCLHALSHEDVELRTDRMLALQHTAAARLAMETAYRRQISRYERKLLLPQQKAMLDKLQRIIAWRINRIIESDAGANLMSLEKLFAAYRKDFPRDKDEVFVQKLIECEELAAKELPSSQSGEYVSWKDRTNTTLALYDNLDGMDDDGYTSMDLAFYINPNLKSDSIETEPSSTRKSMKDLGFQAKFISTRILKPDCEVGTRDIPAEEKGLYPYLTKLVSAELQTFPEANDNMEMFLMYHERTSAEHIRHLVDAAIEKYNANNETAYKGLFSDPGDAEKTMAMWPDLYKGESAAKSNADVTATPIKVDGHIWLTYAKMVIFSEIFESHKAEYETYKSVLKIRDVMKKIRQIISHRMKEMPREDIEKIVSTQAAVEMYRRFYPASTDLQLMQVSFKECVLQASLDALPFSKRHTAMKRTAAMRLSNETAYRRQITEDERRKLSHEQRIKLIQLQQIISLRLNRILENNAGAKYKRPEEMIAAYRKDFPSDKDEAFVRKLILMREDKGARRPLDTQLSPHCVKDWKHPDGLSQFSNAEENREEEMKYEEEEYDLDNEYVSSVKIRKRVLTKWIESYVRPLASRVIRSRFPNIKGKVATLEKEKHIQLCETIRTRLKEVVGSKQPDRRLKVKLLYLQKYPSSGNAKLLKSVLRSKTVNKSINLADEITSEHSSEDSCDEVTAVNFTQGDDDKPGGSIVEENAGAGVELAPDDIQMNDEDLEDY